MTDICQSESVSRILRQQLNVLLCLFGLLQPIFAQDWVVDSHLDDVRIFSTVPLSTDTLHQRLSEVRQEVLRELKLKSAPEYVEVIIFGSFTEYQKHLAGHVAGLSNRPAIFYSNEGTLQIYAVRHRDLVRDLRHEYTHAMLHSNLPYVPLWLDEGIAEYFEELPQQRARSSRLRSVRWKSRTGWAPNLAGLEKIPSAAEMTHNNYRDSWAWVHYLLQHSDESRIQLQTFLNRIAAGEAPGRFSDWLNTRKPSLRTGAGSYFRKIRFSLR